MAGSLIRITISGDDQIAKKLGQLGNLNTRGLFARIGETVRFQTDQRFEQQGFASPGDWPPLARQTVASSFTRRGKNRQASGSGFDRFAGRRKILQDTGRLRLSIQWQLLGDGSGVLVGTNVKYAAAHQFGSTHDVRITPKMRKWAWAKFYETGSPLYKGIALTKKSTMKVKIPARPFLGITEPNRVEITQVINDWLQEQIG